VGTPRRGSGESILVEMGTTVLFLMEGFWGGTLEMCWSSWGGIRVEMGTSVLFLIVIPLKLL